MALVPKAAVRSFSVEREGGGRGASVPAAAGRAGTDVPQLVAAQPSPGGRVGTLVRTGSRT
jgi:hypothetical protein